MSVFVDFYAELIYRVVVSFAKFVYKEPSSVHFSEEKHSKMIKLSIIAERIFNVLTRIVSKKTKDNYEMGVHYQGVTLFIRPFMFTELVMVSGLWEPYVSKILDREIKPRDVFVDIGANIGIYAIPLAKRLGKVIAFEPHPKTSQLLEESIEINHLDNVLLIKKPVGDSKEKISFDLTDEPVHAGFNIKSYKSSSSIKIQIVDLDTALAMESKIDWLLIDVNTFEVNVLNGARNILRKHAPKIIIEHRPYNALKVNEILTKEGYSVTNIHDDYYYAVKK
jgi:FkbM family methyltransferase